MAQYFVGDIQGCYQPLMRLLDHVNFDPAVDILYPVGDLVARGDDSLAVAKLMLSLGQQAQPVLGNHDLHLMAIHSGLRHAKKNDKLAKLLESEIIDSYVNWLREQPLVKHIDDIVMVHAGWYPGWHLDTLLKRSKKASKKLQSKEYVSWLSCMYGNEPSEYHTGLDDIDMFRFTINACTRMRYLKPDLSLDLTAKMPTDDAPDHLKPWYNFQTLHMKNYHILFGHWASLLGVTGIDNVIALDTGCVWGNNMTMLEWQSKTYYAVK
ncbi:symmetrical bis(5'-nucleosyl)-tetraphosphatase [Algibacillus agarilyticus]|uniref:symmetrical bis(5'-nucleosyl)-tetraphosphatase n=1 Tax=Algibacillus agarilyticus TaxID=2234133 RepID=UPI000DD0C2C4|nr:symmetrical bis(5'-nucleosyl)-tetraphosphatase [Algibacillus agarilyticus]